MSEKITMSLDEVRAQVNQIDKQILALLAKRRACSLAVAKSKIATQKPVRDIEREQVLLTELISEGQTHQLDAQYITKIFQTIIEDSILCQQAYLQRLANPSYDAPIVRVSFLGGQGSYSDLAARDFFARKHTKLTGLSCQDFKQVIEQVENGNADYGILPIENTSSGSINDVYDRLQHTRLSIVGEITQPIEHCILTAVETELEKISVLYSHPQPHQQCSEFLHSLGNIKLESCQSTAEAMALVAKEAKPHIGAIGNAASGELYGLKALKFNIANQQENHTRFIVVSRKAIEVTALIPAKTTFIMSTGQTPGALVDCLLILKNHGINMTKLESRPVIGNPWEEMFYVDVEANIRAQAMKTAIKQLSQITHYLKVLGCYPIENITPTEIDLFSQNN